jgi:hypothetical protein
MFYEFLIFLMSIFHFSILCQNSFKTVIFTENSKSIGPVAALPVKFQMAGILVMKPKRIALHYLRTVRSCVSFGTGVIAPGFFNQETTWPRYLVGGLEHEFYDFPCIGNVIIPTDFHIFQRGRSTTKQFGIPNCFHG